jgi:hypothetical protein
MISCQVDEQKKDDMRETCRSHGESINTCKILVGNSPFGGHTVDGRMKLKWILGGNRL